MALFSKEKDIFLKIVNSILVLAIIFSSVIAFATGLKVINKEQIGSYKTYSKKVCNLSKLEYECDDESCKKELDKEREKTCTKYYLKEKKEANKLNKLNIDNFIISISTLIILILFLRVLNRK